MPSVTSLPENPAQAASRVPLGTLLMRARMRREFDAVEEIGNRILAANAKNDFVQRALARQFDELGQPDKAVAHWQALRDGDPRDFEASFHLADALVRAGETPEKAVARVAGDVSATFGAHLRAVLEEQGGDQAFDPGLKNVVICGVSYSGSTLIDRLLGGLPGTASIGESHWLTKARGARGHGPIDFDVENPAQLVSCSGCGPNCEVLTFPFRRRLAADHTNWFYKIAKQLGTHTLISADKNPPKIADHDPLMRFDALVLFKSPVQAWMSALRKLPKDQDPTFYQRKCEQYVALWADRYRILLDNLKPQGKVIFVHFDAFVQEPRKVLERICKALDLPFDAAALESAEPRHAIGGNPDAAAKLYSAESALEIVPLAESDISFDQRETVENAKAAQDVFAHLLSQTEISLSPISPITYSRGMPLIRYSSEIAVQNRKNNPFAQWGDRGAPNRVEPIATPSFDVPFKLSPGEPIFTVGSCFARNVEAELANRGFDIPARALFRRPEFSNLDSGIINNYGTPSIFNEFAWAFGEREFVSDDHIVEVMPGKFADQHVSPSLRPETRDVILARRRAITESYRSAVSCRTVIMTLGLSEVWFDTKSGYYLNVSPRPSTLKANPERYELHVLSFEEAYGFLKDALLLLKKHGPQDMRVLLTVSPVPLQVTQRPVDVMVANTYSKSVLRTAAETAVAELPFVSYFPSYESVMLSDRKIAWLDDLIHVSEPIVRHNIKRMVDAFVGTAEGSDEGEIAEGDEATAIMRAQSARAGGGDQAVRFFAQNGGWSQKSLPFATEHARILLDQKNPQGAIDVLTPWRDQGDTAALAMLCEALLSSGRNTEALATLEVFAGKRVKSIALWDAIYKAALATNDPDLVVSVLASITSHVGARKPLAYHLAARFFRDRGDAETAIRYFKVSYESARTNLVALEFADLLVNRRRLDEAREYLRGLEPANAGETTRLRRLTELLGPSA